MSFTFQTLKFWDSELKNKTVSKGYDIASGIKKSVSQLFLSANQNFLR